MIRRAKPEKVFIMENAVLFDLGNTLVYYFERSEFPSIFEQAITEVERELSPSKCPSQCFHE